MNGINNGFNNHRSGNKKQYIREAEAAIKNQSLAHLNNNAQNNIFETFNSSSSGVGKMHQHISRSGLHQQ